MLIILFICALFRTLHGAPVNGFPALDLRDPQVHLGDRGVSDIIVSCFATIFACTWSAVHPNIPAPTDCGWTRFKRQFVTMVYALLVPEVITAWALRQRLAAKKIVDEYNICVATNKSQEKPILFVEMIRTMFHDSSLPPTLKDGEVPQWTLAHGFLVQMGGFMLSKGGRPIQTLSANNTARVDKEATIKWNIENGIIDPPLITQEDIKDRSKGDTISKTLIILQTTWFIVQCIARWTNRLPVTELEVVTLGFAMLNGITYALWWHKPQNVGRPVYLEIRKTRSDATRNEPESSTINETPRASDTESEFILPHPSPRKQSWWFRRKLREQIEDRMPTAPWTLLWRVPLLLIEALLLPLDKIAKHEVRTVVKRGNLCVPMFYSDSAGMFQVYKTTAVIGVLFGSVHLISSWFLDFPSVQEMWLWRVSAVVITVGPVFLGLWQSMHYFSGLWGGFMIRGFAIIMGSLYIISRIIILILSLISLRALPVGAFQTIQWTTFIPHV
ncbi:hypothetical protein BJ912DRAFT_1062700 [Pholiota molesta]|nr:hypothetical protein BJ912DRAFT_1062700 [Pholiota molesta]